MGLTLEFNRELDEMLQRKVSMLPKVEDVVKANIAELQEGAQRRAPVDTGTLKRSIYQKTGQEGTSIVGEVGAEADYDPYQEYGTRYQPGKPHLRPAYYEQVPKFRKAMYEVAKK
ncbi:HK97-gp10 family putative phage morphogenesis protein [Lapidilactobacillus bayanensis]|uniref:HK97-gp10 family putative phage morphogenesis protein n=1 Tax=Lapidilactobacillus bayanensis TaxID=2485998 RepID=UPI000F76DFEB|nr:HK97-gp10 family putative phage morphogenesis protein [Lapidilactobacillus bayanensis]